MKTLAKYRTRYRILIVCLSPVLFSCQTDRSQQKLGSQEVPLDNIPRVEVVHPTSQMFDSEIVLTGNLKPNQSVNLFAMESGFVKSIIKDIGDRVNQNEIIARLENPEIMRKLEIDKAQFMAKKSIFERLESISSKTPDLTTLEQVEIAKAEFLSARSNYHATKARTEFLLVRAPFPGIITKRFVDRGAVVQSGLNEDNPQPIVEIMDIEKLRLEINIPEHDMATLKPGSSAQVLFPELPDQEFDATITRMAGALNPQTKTMNAEIDLPNEDHRLSPGMYARVTVKLRSRRDALSLPLVALIAQKNQFFVFRVDNEVVTKIPVRIGLKSKNFFEVLNQDISEKDQIIIGGKELVNDGMKVISSKLKGGQL